MRSFAGTVGAIVTCPLEVVKTRLQSSSSHFYPSPLSQAGRTQNGSEHMRGSTQNRDLFKSILRKRAHVSHATSNASINQILIPTWKLNCCFRIFFSFIAFFKQILTMSHCGMSSAPRSISIWQCLKWVQFIDDWFRLNERSWHLLNLSHSLTHFLWISDILLNRKDQELYSKGLDQTLSAWHRQERFIFVHIHRQKLHSINYSEFIAFCAFWRKKKH